MSSGDKLPKVKAKKSAPQKPKSAKGKELSFSENRFRGDGVKFKCKLIGSVDVSGARGDAMCAEAIKKLKAQAKHLNKEIGEHKQKITLLITIKGIRIVDEKTQIVQHEQPINKISFITHDPEDRKIFGYVCSQPCTTGHKLFAVKSEKPASVVTGTLYELFQVVFKLRKEAELKKKAAPVPPTQVSNGPNQPQSPEGMYEVPFKNGSKTPTPVSPEIDHDYAEPIPSSSRDPHYKVPSAIPVQTSPSSDDSRAEDSGHEQNIHGESSLHSQDNSNTDLAFFSPSVFESTLNESGVADTTSLASAADIQVVRSESVSSGSSGAVSLDTRSVDSKSGSLNQPPSQEVLSPVSESSGNFQVSFANFEDSAASLSLESKSQSQEVETGAGDGRNNFEADFTSGNIADKEENPDLSSIRPVNQGQFEPFKNSFNEEKSAQSSTTDSFAVFDTAFDNTETKNDSKENRGNTSSSEDPFAPTDGTLVGSSIAQRSAAFEADFGTAQFASFPANSDGSERTAEETNEDVTSTEKQSIPAENFSCTWVNDFGNDDSASELKKEEMNTKDSDKQFTWSEKVAANSAYKENKQEAPPFSSFSWDEAFCEDTSPVKVPASSNAGADAFSWDDAFGGKAAEPSGFKFDSSPFGDAFPVCVAEESDSSLPTESEPSALQPSNLSDKEVDIASHTATSPDDKGDNDTPGPSKDSFEEVNKSFSATTAKSKKNDLEPNDLTMLSNGTCNSDEQSSDITLRFQANFSQLYSDTIQENSDNPDDVNMLDDGEGQPCESFKSIGNKHVLLENKDGSGDGTAGQISEEAPSQLAVQEPQLPPSERPVSPSAPPPLPPRPIVSPPPLPARPKTVSSTGSSVSAGMSPVSPQVFTGSPKSNSPVQTRRSAKKAPPAPPPRVDLNEKAASDNLVSSDLFSSTFGHSNTPPKQEESTWTASWPSSDVNTSNNTSNEEKSSNFSDPFSDEFFTNFDFPPKTTGTSAAAEGNADPFASTQSGDPFTISFGEQDLFASFPPSQGGQSADELDPFSGDLSGSFSAFPSKDPFSDISDPFADRGVLSDDPFADSPRKPQPGETITLNESLVASDEADSFA